MTNPIRKEVTIGNCRLLLGDCLEILPMLGKVDHVITDPPYSNLVHDTRGRRGGDLRRDGGPELEKIAFSSIDGIQDTVARLICRVNAGWFIAFSDVFALPAWRDAVLSAGCKSKSVALWLKPDCAPQFNGQKPATAFECIGVFWCGGGFSRWNSGGKRGVYTYLTNNRERDGRHPTEKPIGLMSEILADFTAPGQLVCDPFMGSGTTGISCARLGRRFVGIERDETHFETARERIQDAVDRPDLFIAPRSPEPVQQPLFGGGEAA